MCKWPIKPTELRLDFFFLVKYRSLPPAMSLRNLLITANYIKKKNIARPYKVEDPTKQIPLKSRTV